jgi:hypothetical protein
MTLLICPTGKITARMFILHARLRVHRTPGIPCALCYRRDNVHAPLGRNPRRENAGVCRLMSCLKFESELAVDVIASEAKQSIVP